MQLQTTFFPRTLGATDRRPVRQHHPRFPAGADLPADTIKANFEQEKELGFTSFALQGVSSSIVDDYVTRAEKAAAAITVSKLTDCDGQSEKDCGRDFVRDFGRKAFRRPLTDTERSRWNGLFEDLLETDGFEDAIRTTLQGFLMAPQFLHRVERGEPVDGNDRLAN